MKLNKAISTHLDFFILIVTSVFCIPFFGLSASIDPVLMPRFLLWSTMTFVLLLSFTVQLIKNYKSLDYSILTHMIFPLFLGHLFFAAISLAKAANITEGIHDVLKIFLSLAYLVVATVLLNKNRNYNVILVKAVMITATILSLIAIYQYFLFAYRRPTDIADAAYSVSATMAHKNQLSSALFLTLPFCLCALLIFRNYWKVISIIPVILILLNIFFLQARSVWLGLLLSTAATVVLVAAFAKRLGVSKRLFLKGFIWAAIVFIVPGSIFGYFYSKSKPIDELIERIKSVSSVDQGSNIERILMWKKSLIATKGNLILGHGAGNWKIVLPSYGLDNLTERSFKYVHFQRPHNDFVWVLFEIGLFGLIFYVSVFAITFVYILRIIAQGSDTKDKLLAICMFLGIVGYTVIAFFSFPKERIFHSVFLMLMTAIVVSTYHQSCRCAKNVARSFILACTVTSLCVLGAAIINGYIRLNGEIHTKRALAARRAQNWPAVISQVDKAYSIFATLDPMATPVKWYRGEANFLLNNVSQALEDYKEAYNAHPYHIHVLNNLATCYELQGQHNTAITYYNKALQIYPQFDEALINLGATYFNSARYDESYETLLRCDPNTTDPRLKKYLKAVEKNLTKRKLPILSN